jgi:20S proteasome alpha/beta subunit
MRVEALTQAVCDLALSFGDGGGGKKMSRPFGVALLMAGFDDKGPQLFFSDPSGMFVQYKAKAIGSGSEGAQTNLQESYRCVSSSVICICVRSITFVLFAMQCLIGCACKCALMQVTGSYLGCIGCYTIVHATY